MLFINKKMELYNDNQLDRYNFGKSLALFNFILTTIMFVVCIKIATIHAVLRYTGYIKYKDCKSA